MSTLDSGELEKMRFGCAGSGIEVNYTKPQVNAALQAIEDWFDKPAVKSALSNNIDAATTPFTFTAAQKKKLVKFWLFSKFGRE